MADEEFGGKEAKPAIDKWKDGVVDALFRLNELYREATKDGVMEEDEQATVEFKRDVCSMWMLMGRAKVYLPKDNRQFRNLFKLDQYRACPREMTVQQALLFYDLLRLWIETLGYTRIESRTMDPTDFPGQKVGL
jgi:hypothetical protein